MVKRLARPLDRYLIVEQVIHETSNIILEDTVQDKSLFDFVVVAVGPECRRGMKEGDIILAADGFMGYPLSDDHGPRHFLVNETDIIAVVDVQVQ